MALTPHPSKAPTTIFRNIILIFFTLSASGLIWSNSLSAGPLLLLGEGPEGGFVHDLLAI